MTKVMGSLAKMLWIVKDPVLVESMTSDCAAKAGTVGTAAIATAIHVYITFLNTFFKPIFFFDSPFGYLLLS